MLNQVVEMIGSNDARWSASASDASTNPVPIVVSYPNQTLMTFAGMELPPIRCEINPTGPECQHAQSGNDRQRGGQEVGIGIGNACGSETDAFE